MRGKRGMVLWMILGLLVSLTGCQLAREEAGAQADRMIGALVALEGLEQFGPETDARLYAVQDEQGRYGFEGVKGSCILAAVNRMYDDISYGDEVAHVEWQQDNWFDDVKKGYAYRDDGESLTAEATVWLEPADETVFLYIHPVYLAADGRVYAAEGEATALDLSLYERGETTTLERTETYFTVRDGQQRTVEASVRIIFGVKYPAERVAVLQMSADNQVIDRRAYAPEALPEDITTAADAAYLLIESHTRDERGDEVVERSAYNRIDEFMKVFVDGGGVCVPRTIGLTWK